MNSLPGKAHAYWVDSTPQTDYPSLPGAGEADVCVVGGGIVGITTAYLLSLRGASVCLLEARRLVEGVTGHTTAKVTSLHSLIYRDLLNKHGEEKARRYGEANQSALKWIARTVEEQGIDCDFRRASAYTVALQGQGVKSVEREVEVALRLGLPADYLEGAALDSPLPARAGVRFVDQAQFHPRKYLLALAQKVVEGGGQIFEGTRARDVEVEKDFCYVKTDKGTVRTRQVILATGMPFLRATTIYTRAVPMGHAVLALATAEAPFEGLYLGVDSSPHSVRPQSDGGRHLVIAASPGLKTGTGSTLQLTRELLQACERELTFKSVEYQWWTEDFYSDDRLPLVGVAGRHNRIFTATGFGGWGMTNGTAAAHLLADLVDGKENAWSELYDPARATVAASVRKFAQHNLEVFKDHLVGARLKDRSGSTAALLPGEGKILELEGEKVGVHRDEQGELHAVSPVCRHLGCYLGWNDAQKTWDCPCHGSRFLPDGTMIQGPTHDDLPRVEIEETSGE